MHGVYRDEESYAFLIPVFLLIPGKSNQHKTKNQYGDQFIKPENPIIPH